MRPRCLAADARSRFLHRAADLDGSFNLLLSVFRHAEPAQFRELMLEMLKQLEAYEGPRDLASLKMCALSFDL